MSATPIFEQLCRDFLDADRVWPADGTHPSIVRQPTGPAHALESTGGGQMSERGSHLPRVLAEWACPTG